jgi:MbtH protein
MNELTKEETKKNELQYYVVKNHEEQYSIWPTYKPIPKGWVGVGNARNKDGCLDYIDKVWTDMRPLSLRKKMEELGMESETQKSKKTYDISTIGVAGKGDRKNAK